MGGRVTSSMCGRSDGAKGVLWGYRFRRVSRMISTNRGVLITFVFLDVGYHCLVGGYWLYAHVGRWRWRGGWGSLGVVVAVFAVTMTTIVFSNVMLYVNVFLESMVGSVPRVAGVDRSIDLDGWG